MYNEKETYINNMNKFLKELDATNEQITVITNVYIAYLESFIKKLMVLIVAAILESLMPLKFLTVILRKTYQP